MRPAVEQQERPEANISIPHLVFALLLYQFHDWTQFSDPSSGHLRDLTDQRIAWPCAFRPGHYIKVHTGTLKFKKSKEKKLKIKNWPSEK